MLDEKALFYGRKADKSALIDYGFACADGAHIYREDILDGQFKVEVTVRGDDVSATVTDKETDGPYFLFRVEGAEGAFVGAVRAEYERILNSISDRCFSAPEAFREATANSVIKYAGEKYGSPLEFLWQDENAVMRRKDNRKWYAAFLKVKAERLGFGNGGTVEIIDLRVPKGEAERLADGVNYLPAYHMNKKSWITIPLD
ncbi:MAG: MmcQ/YjbR family DNA-binding protein, partial [Clostridia bacterium]|nr:MmcQ/YjbR family DNA-binding protein [Clostridia bacterium]